MVYTKKQKQDALEAIKNGMSIKDAEDYSGVKANTIYHLMKKEGIKVLGRSYKCPEPGCENLPPFTSTILYAQHRSAKHPHGGKRVMKSSQRKPQITNAFADKQGGSHTVNETFTVPWQVVEDNIVARVIKHFEDNPQAINSEVATIEKTVEAYLKAHPVKITTDEFMGMLKTLVSENTQRGEELARLRKSLGEWQQRAGRIMEQAQELATKK